MLSQVCPCDVISIQCDLGEARAECSLRDDENQAQPLLKCIKKRQHLCKNVAHRVPECPVWNQPVASASASVSQGSQTVASLMSASEQQVGI